MTPVRSRFLVLGACVTFVLAGLGFRYGVHPVWKNAECVENLTLLRAAFTQYAEANKDFFPLLARTRGGVTFDSERLYPTYLLDSAALISPFHPDAKIMREQLGSSAQSAFGGHSYWYLGCAIRHERSGVAWVDAVRQYIDNGTPIASVREIWPDCKVVIDAKQAALEPENNRRREVWEREAALGIPPRKRSVPTDRGEKLYLERVEPSLEDLLQYYPLREGVERFFITEIGNPAGSKNSQALIPIMVERPELHGNGGHVLYMDGHVEFMPYPGKFPMTPAFIEGLRSLDAMEKAN